MNEKQLKRAIYIAAFVVLGVLLQQIVHAGLEMMAIYFLLTDFGLYGLGLSWDAWYMIHALATFVLLVGGIVFGWWQGVYWWRVIYIQKRRWRSRK